MKPLTIGEVARQAGVGIETVRFYERQGLLVESEALARAENECAGDEAARKISRERAVVVRERADKEYVAQFANEIRLYYPGCPAAEAEIIAEHACQKPIERHAPAKPLQIHACAFGVFQ